MSDMISIIIPAYNAADYLAQTIESVLNQTYSDFELILIDDGSTDRTREIIKDYQCKDARIKYFYKENGGVSSARNLGLQKATGDFVSFLDSDDLWDRRFLESMYHKLVAGGELACFCGYIEKRGDTITRYPGHFGAVAYWAYHFIISLNGRKHKICSSCIQGQNDPFIIFIHILF